MSTTAQTERLSLEGWDDEETQVFASPLVVPVAPITSTWQPNRVEVDSSRVSRFVNLLGMLMLCASATIGGLTLWPRHGGLRVSVGAATGEPLTRAAVYVDGKLVCEAVPCVLDEIGLGLHRIRVTAPGFAPSRLSSAEVTPGSETALAVTLHPTPRSTAVAEVAEAAPSMTTIEATSQPRPALRGRLPLAPSSEPQATENDTTEADENAPSWSSPPDGMALLQINSIPPSRVLLDGKRLGRTPLVDRAVGPGAHTITFEHAQHGQVTRTIEVAAGDAASVGHRF